VREVPWKGSHPPLGRGALNLTGPHLKLVNLVNHDGGTLFGAFEEAAYGEIYGSIGFFPGWKGPDRDHGPAIYTHNSQGMSFVDNILLFGYSHLLGLRGGSGGVVNHYLFEGNVFINEKQNILAMPTAPLNRSASFLRNYVITPPEETGDPNWICGLMANCDCGPSDSPGNCNRSCSPATPIICQDWSFIENYVVGRAAPLHLGDSLLSNAYNTVIRGNVFFNKTGINYRNKDNACLLQGQCQWPDNQHFSFDSSPPSGVQVFVRKNRYDPSRAHIVVFNWDKQSVVSVDLSTAGLEMGEAYEVRDAQHYFGPPVAVGVYDGAPVTLRMQGLTIAEPVGLPEGKWKHTDEHFGVFVVIGSPGVATPRLSPHGAAFASKVNVTLSDVTPGASIHYTLDGSVPTTISPLYTGPIALKETTVLKARAFKEGLPASDTNWATFRAPVDRRAPRLASVTATTESLTHVTVVFTSPVDLQSATQPANYQLSDATVTAAQRVAQRMVILSTTPLTPLASYTLTVGGVANVYGSSMTFVATPPDLEQGLIGHWRFDEGQGEVAHDSSPSLNDGTLVNNPIWFVGKVGNALYFKGEAHVLLKKETFDETDWTIAAWILVPENLSQPPEASAHIAGYIHHCNLSIISAGGDRVVAFHYPTSDVPTQTYSTRAINNGTWHHIVGMRQGDIVRLFINGKQSVPDVPYSGTGTAERVGVESIGARIVRKPKDPEHPELNPYEAVGFFEGAIDEVRIYNRALTPVEIGQLGTP
jgi:hypothetical protein